MMSGIEGRTAIVGGSSSGLGYATAEHLARSGARVMVVSRNIDRVSRAVEKIRADTGGAVEGCVADFTDDDAPRAVVEATKKHILDLLGVAVAGSAFPGNSDPVAAAKCAVRSHNHARKKTKAHHQDQEKHDAISLLHLK